MSDATRRDGSKLGCLVCRGTDGGFLRPEHPIPESLGNTEFILPPGVVCDRCNHGRLADLDRVLCEFKPISFRRTMLSVPSKTGKVPTTRFLTGHVESPEPGVVAFTPSGGKDMIREVARGEEGVTLRMELAGGPRMTQSYASSLARSLLKVGLGLAWLDLGEGTMDPSFDHVRDIVLGAPRAGYIAIGRGVDGPPFDGVSVTHNPERVGDEMRFIVVANIFGVEMATDSRRPGPQPPIAEVADVTRYND